MADARSAAAAWPNGAACRGRFAPSPTGPLHPGSLVAALGSWLDARAQGGVWLLRIEDVDMPRCAPGADEVIVRQLAALGLNSDEPIWRQSTRADAYDAALQALVRAGRAYPCACTRQDIERHWARRGIVHPPGVEVPYPGTCRNGLRGRAARAWRFRVEAGYAGVVHWQDRRLGPQVQNVAQAVGDFVLKRADGLWAYQLAVVVDDAAQRITDIVRGEDLADNTPRQILLQRALSETGTFGLEGVPTPRYLHLPLVLAADGRKLSKQNGAQPLDLCDPVSALQAAGAVLGLPRIEATRVVQWLAQAVPAWDERRGSTSPCGVADGANAG